MPSGLSSRQRVLSALDFQEPDYVPCCFSAFMALSEKCASQEEFVDRQLEMGLDVPVNLAELPMRHDPRVKIKQWREEPPGGPYPVLHCEYQTPTGVLRRTVNQSEDWPHGDRVPFISDHIIPRATRHLVTPEDSLDALRYLLAAPTNEDVKAYRSRWEAAKRLASERGLVTVGGVGMHGDMACWLSGIEPLMIMCADHPAFVLEYLAIIEKWNRQRMEVTLGAGVDIFVRRGWYESADFWSPRTYREFQLPALKRDAEQVHGAGAKLGYIMSCSSMPLLDQLMEAGVDVLMGVDPAQDRMMNMPVLKERTMGRMALWGGVCGYLTVECGSQADIRREVQNAISVLAPGGGFILAPVTNVRADTAQSWENVRTLVQEWKRLRKYPIKQAAG